jgi:hypothetical protein
MGTVCSLEMIQNMYVCKLMSGKITKCTREKNGLYGGNVEIIAISVIHKVSVNVYFASEGQTTRTATVIVAQVPNEINF